jgi:uncharacterized membrane protein
MDGWELILLLLVVLLLIGPILGIAAWVRVRRLQRESLPPEEVPRLLARIYKLELRLEKLEQRAPEPAPAAVAEKAPAAEPRVKPKEVAPPPAPAPPVTPPPAPPPHAEPPRPAVPAPPPQPPQQRPAAPVPPPSATAPPPPAQPPLMEHRPLFRLDAATPVRFAGKTAFDLESLIAGRWLYFVGLALVFLAAMFFVIYAFEHNWIGPRARVTIGILAGTFLLGFSHWLRGRGFSYFSEGVTGLGVALLYLSLWAGSNYYHLFSQAVGFFAMIAVTAAMVTIAAGRNSQRLALVALLGGFLTPVLVSTGQNAQVELFSYLLLLDATLLVLARVRDWRWLELPAFAATQLFFWGWYDRFYDSGQLLSTMVFAALFFLLFTVLPAIHSRQRAALHSEQATVLFSNALAYLLALRSLLWPEYKWTLTFAVLLLAVLHLYIARFVPRPADKDERPLAYFLYAGLALTFATLAIPIRLEGRWITIGWAVEAAVLMWTGFRVRMWQLRGAAFLLFAFVLFRIVMFPEPAARFLFNSRFGLHAVVVACLALSVYFWRRNREDERQWESISFNALAVAASFLLLVTLTLETHLFFAPEPRGVWYLGSLAQSLAITALWFVYATGLISAGLLRRVPGLRFQAYVVYGVATLKLFLLDAQNLDEYFAHFAFNPRFIALAVVVASLALARRLGRREVEALAPPEPRILQVLGVVIHVVALLGLSFEVHQYFIADPGLSLARDTRLAQQLAVTALWFVYATGLISAGLLRRTLGLRYQAYVLYTVAAVKLFLLDARNFDVHFSQFAFNPRFIALAVVVAGLALALRLARREVETLASPEPRLLQGLSILVHVVALLGLSLEVYHYFVIDPGLQVARDTRLAQQLAVTALWSVYATGLVSIGLLRRALGLRYQAYVLYGAAALKLFLLDAHNMNVYFTYFAFNPRFAALAVVVVGLALALGLARREAETLAPPERHLMQGLGVLIHLVALLGLSLEVYQYFVLDPSLPLDRDTRLAQQMGLSLLWTIYAATLVISGVRWARVGLRYQGLALFAITIAKVFFFDLSFLSGIYRIVSSFALGVLLLVVAFLYQRMLQPGTEPEGQ